MTTTTNLGMTLVEQSQAQKEVTINEAFTCIDALMNTGAINIISTPPGLPAQGDLYIVGASPTGAWTGQANAMAYYDQVWRFVTPKAGMQLYVQQPTQYYWFDGSIWNSLLSAYDKYGTMSVTSNTTLADVPGMGVTLPLGVYSFRIIGTGTADAAGGFKVGTGGSVAFSNFHAYGWFDNAGTYVGNFEVSASGLIIGYTATTHFRFAIEGNCTVSTAGLWTTQFAQNVSDATASNLAQCWVQTRRIA